MSLKHRARVALQSLGVDVRRFPDGEPGHSTVQLLRRHQVDLVLDVGANDGGFALELRRFGYAGRIVSFEPLAAPFARLQARAAADPAWSTVQCALGATDEVVTINVASNAEASSSVLPMLDRHLSAAPTSAYRATEQVQQRRLDDLWPEVRSGATRPYLKVDVQGYEAQVLDGAADLLDGPLIGVQLELSLVPLYEGGLAFDQAFARMRAAGLRLAQFYPGFRDTASGELLQADGVFLRAD